MKEQTEDGEGLADGTWEPGHMTNDKGRQAVLRGHVGTEESEPGGHLKRQREEQDRTLTPAPG